MRAGSLVVLIWLIIGSIAAGQRRYYGSSSTTCAHTGTILVTIIAGPLNYVGVNPKISCHLPFPEQLSPGASFPGRSQASGAKSESMISFHHV